MTPGRRAPLFPRPADARLRRASLQGRLQAASPRAAAAAPPAHRRGRGHLRCRRACRPIRQALRAPGAQGHGLRLRARQLRARHPARGGAAQPPRQCRDPAAGAGRPLRRRHAQRAGEALGQLRLRPLASRRGDGARPVEVEAVAVATLDAVAEALALERLDFIKADIEGFELRLLRGARGDASRASSRRCSWR